MSKKKTNLLDLIYAKYSTYVLHETLVLPIRSPYRRLFDTVLYGWGIPKVKWCTSEENDEAIKDHIY